MKRSLFAIGMLLALLLLACGGGDDDAQSDASPTRTPRPARATSTASAKATATKKPAAIPEKPAQLPQFASAIESYLNEAPPSELEPECLQALFEDWDMDWNAGSPPCLAGNTDADAEDEMAVLLSAISPDTSSWQVVVFDLKNDAYETAYQSEPVEVPGNLVEWRPALVAAGDINRDDKGELVYIENVCGAHTCSIIVHVLTGTPSGYVSLASDEVTMATATVSLEDTDGDGLTDILLHGGTIGSVGAGAQRERTEIYAWDGGQYTLRETTLDPTNILYLHVTEADALFATGLYDQAFAIYEAALNDPTLVTWKEPADMVADERPELYAYILFRMGLSSFGISGPNAQGYAYIEQADAVYLGYIHGDMAKVFLDNYDATNNVSQACAAVEGFIAENLNILEAFWDYGYANPTFNAEAVCPF